MLNVVVPMAGKSLFFAEEQHKFPKPLIEIDRKMMIEHVIAYLDEIEQKKRLIFIVNERDARLFHIDDIIRLVAGSDCTIVYQRHDTMGAVCSVLLAIEHINNDEPLIISNADQVLESGVNEALQMFEEKEADGGVICFDSMHPQWSYVALDENGQIVETAEKRPISRNAIAGFYYFRQGRVFVEAAMRMISKGVNVNGRYFLSLIYNEMVLDRRKLFPFKIDSRYHHSFYSPDKIKEYEQKRTIQQTI